MIKPLIINRDFLFANSPGGECLRSFVGGMDPSKWSPVIYASDGFPLIETHYDNVNLVHEKKFVRYVAAAIRRILIPDLTWLPGYEWQAWGSDTANRVLNDIKRKVIIPDYIHSVSYPLASHMAAMKVKKKTGLPWVMQFYDPWADSPYRPFKTKRLKKKDWAMEREASEIADVIIHDNENIAEIWRERYGDRIAKKIVVLPLTVPLPKSEVTHLLHEAGTPLVISHIGNFMLNRKAKPFINAISVLVKKYPQIRELLKINFIGRVTTQDVELISQNGLDDLFILHGTLSADDCEKFYNHSDLFLAIDGVNRDNIFFPSKILKYFYYSRPILGITPKGSVMDNELEKANYAHFADYEQSKIVDYMFRAVYDYDSICNFDKDYWCRFKPSRVINEYEKIIVSLLK